MNQTFRIIPVYQPKLMYSNLKSPPKTFILKDLAEEPMHIVIVLIGLKILVVNSRRP